MEILIIATLAYFLPFIIACIRGHGSKWAIFFTVLFFGWSMIGWIIAFIWAFGSTHKNGNITIVNNQNNG